jgi:hypothetical protein
MIFAWILLKLCDETIMNPCFKILIIISTIALQWGQCGVMNQCVILKFLHTISNFGIHSPPLSISTYFGTQIYKLLFFQKSNNNSRGLFLHELCFTPLKIMMYNSHNIFVVNSSFWQWAYNVNIYNKSNSLQFMGICFQIFSPFKDDHVH